MNGLREKIDTNKQLWEDCFDGKKEALDNMAEYCAGDVICLQEHYIFFRPYMKGHPNLGIYMDTDKTVCPNCGCDKITRKPDIFVRRNVTYVGTYTCDHCGCFGQYGKNELTKKDAIGKDIHKKKRLNLGRATTK